MRGFARVGRLNGMAGASCRCGRLPYWLGSAVAHRSLQWRSRRRVSVAWPGRGAVPASVLGGVLGAVRYIVAGAGDVVVGVVWWVWWVRRELWW